HPVVVMRIGAAGVLHILEVRSRRRIQRPSLGALLPGGLRPVEWTFAFPPVEARQMPTPERDPGDVIAVEVHSARRKALHWSFRVAPRHFVVFRQSGLGRIRSWSQPDDTAREAQHAAPDGPVG